MIDSWFVLLGIFPITMAIHHLSQSQRIRPRLETVLLANGSPAAHHDTITGPHHLAGDDQPLQRSPLLRFDISPARFPTGWTVQFGSSGHPARSRREAAGSRSGRLHFGAIAHAETSAPRPQSCCCHRQRDSLREFQVSIISIICIISYHQLKLINRSECWQFGIGDQFGIGAPGRSPAFGGLGGPARGYDGDFAEYQAGVSGGGHAHQKLAAVPSGDDVERVDGQDVQRSGRCPHWNDALQFGY